MVRNRVCVLPSRSCRMHATTLMVHNPVGVGYAYGVQLKPISYVITRHAMKNGWCLAESCITEAGAGDAQDQHDRMQVTCRIGTTQSVLQHQGA